MRRVGRFDIRIVQQAVLVNRPTKLALMGVDYLSYDNYKAKELDDLTTVTKEFIRKLEKITGVKVYLIGTGPETDDLIEIRT